MRTSISLAWVLLLLCAHAASAATVVTRTLREDGTGSYTNLADWENARQRDLVAADEIERLVIEGAWSKPLTAQLLVDGWNTDTSHWIEITNSTSKHGGKWNESAFRLDVTNSTPIALFEENVRLYGVQIRATASSGTVDMVSHTVTAGEIRIEDCIFRGNITGTASSTWIWNPNAGSKTTLVNCIGYNTTNSTVVAVCANVSAFNCTFANVNRGFFYATAATNCVVQDCGYGFDAFSGTPGDYNCSDDSTAPGANSVKSYEVPFASETLGAEDYHLTSSASSIIGAGLDSPASGNSNDIDGQDRSDWDIGADEFYPPMGQVVIVVSE